MFNRLKIIVLVSIFSAITTAVITYFVLVQHPDLTPADGVLVNGMSYHGDLENGLLQGNAVLENTGGTRYSGFFVDGLLQGQGNFSDGLGGHYSGSFIDGEKEGVGTYEYYDGSKYTGHFKNNNWHGKGEFLQNNGDRYDGEFSEGFLHGDGVYLINNSLTYTGRFEKNEFKQGKAEITGMTLEGEFSNWSLNGKGTITDQTNTVTKGAFVDGVINGVGTQTLADGSHYEGEFKSGMRHGKGQSVDAEGNTYNGSFEYGRFHGAGELILATAIDGISRVSGYWSWGSLENDPRNPKLDYSENVEHLLYSQNTLLSNALEQVKLSNADSADLFFLGVAGYGSQDVFLKEIRYLREYIHPFTENRTVTLVNNHTTINEFPLATRHSVRVAIEGIEEKMDVDNDILFVYMTSHGSKDHKFSIELDGLSLPSINAVELADTLKQSKIKWKIIVISACYAGGFIEGLADENTLVITAARNDRTSFGCSTESDMTYFGRAYFQEAMPKKLSFIEAFHSAKDHVKIWEKRDFPDSKNSLPQMSLGKNIEKKLEFWKHPLGES